MRAIAAVVILAASSLRSLAQSEPSRDIINISTQHLIRCARTLGPSKCIAAFGDWRAENALSSIKEHNFGSNLKEDIEKFQWERYANSSDDELFSKLCIGTERLLQYRTLNFNMVPGYEIQLASKGNGTLNIDVFNSPENETSRGMKKMKKMFYNIVPYLLIPGLIMSAILPFVLPALKMMTMAVVMLNNMALSGAVFTLLRNNAFNDRYDKKVIYVNEGYMNEKSAHVHKHKPEIDIHYETSQDPEIPEHEHISGSDFDVAEEIPDANYNDWMNYYKFVKVAKQDAWNEDEKMLRV